MIYTYFRNLIDGVKIEAIDTADEVVARSIQQVKTQVEAEIAQAKYAYVTKPLENINLALNAWHKATLGILLISSCALLVSSFFTPVLPSLYLALKASLLVGAAAAVLRYTSDTPKSIDRAVDFVYYPIELLARAKNFLSSKFTSKKPQPILLLEDIDRAPTSPAALPIRLDLALRDPIGFIVPAYRAGRMRSMAKPQPLPGLVRFVPQNHNWLKNR